MKLYIKLIFILIILSSVNIFGQVINTENGKIEFIGLQKWNAQELLDSLKVLNPNKPIAACAATLKSNLGFADASVIIYMDDNSKPYTVVSLIENKFSDRIKYLPEPTESGSILIGWNEAVDLITSNQMLVQATIMTYGLFKNNQPDSAINILNQWPVNIIDVRIFWKFLEQHATKNDKELALWILQNDLSFTHRAIALSVLMNFHLDDDTWWNLMNHQRSENHRISALATLILKTMSENSKKDVFWAPAVNSIKHIINGTNPFAFLATLDVLRKTNFSKELCGIIFKDKPNLLIFYLNVQHEKTKSVVYNFLSHISGLNYKNPEDWKNWINNL